MAPRRQKPLERVLQDAAFANLSDDKGQRLIFDYYKRAGYLPAKDAQGHTFKSLQEYLSTVQRLAEQERRKNPNAKPAEWLKAAEARLGFNRQIRSAKTGQDLSIVAGKQLEDPKQKFAKNRVGSVFPLEIGDNGKVRFNKRKYMSAEGGLPRPVYDFISSKHGQEVADTYQKAVRKEWKTMGDVGRELAAKTGIPFDRGHWLSNKYGGAESARAGALEIAVLNRLHGAAPRGNIERLKVTGRTSSGWLDDFYEWDFTNNKLNVLGSEHLKVSDLQEIVNGTKDPNQIAAQRLAEWEARGRTPDPDPIGNIFGSQLGGETINQQRLRMMEEQLDSVFKTGIDPQTGNPVSPERLEELQRGAKAAKKSTKLMPTAITRSSVPQPTTRPEEFESALRAFSNRAERRLGRGVFEDVLDTTTDTYKQMIGSMQPFLNLSDDQKAALNLYGQDGKQFYAQLNRLLRAGDAGKLSNQELKTLNYIKDNLTEALTSLQSEPSQVYRGVSGSQVADFEKLKVGDTFIDKGFGSYSDDESAARRFLSRDKPSTLISVSNSSARNITPVAEYSESEFLAKPNTQYAVKDIQETINKKTGKPIRHIILDEIPARQLMPKGVTRNPLMRGAAAISRAIPGPVDALLPGVVGGGLALAGGATLPQAAEAFGAGVAEGLTGDLEGGPMANYTSYNVNGKQRFINVKTNELMDKPGYGLEQSGGQWREVKRGTGAASQQQRQAIRSTAQQAANLIPKVNRAINPVGAGIMDFLTKPIGSAFGSIFGNKREI